MILAGKTVHETAIALDLDLDTVRVRSAEVRKRLFDEGVACACGKPTGHQYLCSANWESGFRRRGQRPIARSAMPAISRELLAGKPIEEIAAERGLAVKQVARARQQLSSADRALRTENIGKRLAASRGVGLNGAATAELIARVHRAIPKGAGASAREDLAAELYLAVVEGRIAFDQIETAADRLTQRERRKGGGQSADEAVWGAGSPSRADLLADTTTAETIDGIMIGSAR
jgi:hypothetical protein